MPAWRSRRRGASKGRRAWFILGGIVLSALSLALVPSFGGGQPAVKALAGAGLALALVALLLVMFKTEQEIPVTEREESEIRSW